MLQHIHIYRERASLSTYAGSLLQYAGATCTSGSLLQYTGSLLQYMHREKVHLSLHMATVRLCQKWDVCVCVCLYTKVATATTANLC